MGHQEAGRPGRQGPAARDAAAAARLGLGLLVAGVGLHAGLLAALGPAPGSSAAVQGAALLAQVGTCVAVAGRRDRLPIRAWTLLVVLVTPLIGTIPPFYPEATLLAVPVLFLLVVFASRMLGDGTARLVTVEAVGVSIWVAAGLDGGPALAAVHVLFVGGVLVLVHETLVRSGRAQARLVARLQHAADVDVLTGLVARRAFEDEVDDALRGATGPVALLLVDVDRFKAVNDEHGHPVGDAALRQVAELVAAGVRGVGGTVGRLGGDELGVLLVGCPEGAALERARELVSAVRAAPLRTEGGAWVPLSISVGVAAAAGGDRSTLYAAADAALYAAKRAGRGRASVDQGHDRRAPVG